MVIIMIMMVRATVKMFIALASQRVDNDFISFYFFKVGPKAEDEFHYNCHRIIPEIA